MQFYWQAKREENKLCISGAWNLNKIFQDCKNNCVPKKDLRATLEVIDEKWWIEMDDEFDVKWEWGFLIPQKELDLLTGT